MSWMSLPEFSLGHGLKTRSLMEGAGSCVYPPGL